MIKRQFYVFLIALMTATQKVCLKKQKALELPLHPK